MLRSFDYVVNKGPSVCLLAIEGTFLREKEVLSCIWVVSSSDITVAIIHRQVVQYLFRSITACYGLTNQLIIEYFSFILSNFEYIKKMFLV